MSVAGNIYDGGGAKGAKFANIGDTIEGQILAIQERQLEEYPPGSGRLETWPSGDPKVTPIVTIQTNQTDDADDDGRRDIYLRSGAYTAFGQALREAYKRKPTDDELIGATVKLRFDSTTPSKYGNPRKVFLCRITPAPASGASDAWDRQPGDEQGQPEPPPIDDVPF